MLAMPGVDTERLTTAMETQGAALVGVINAATAELTRCIAAVLATGTFGGAGFRSPEHWVAVRFGLSTARARGLVAIARRRHDLAAATAAFDRGELDEGHMALLARKVPAAREAEALTLAHATTVSQFAKALQALPDLEPPTAAPAAAPVRSVRGHYRDDGWWEAHLLVPGHEGAVIATSWDAAWRDLTHPTTSTPVSDAAGGGVVPVRLTRADAALHAAEAALRALDPDTRAGRPAGERYQVLIHVDATTHAAHLHLGPALDATTRRLLTCDTTVRYLLTHAGTPIAKGRRQHTVDPVLRAVIEHRDHTCRIPGCTRQRALHIHHLHHWQDGGPTNPDNLVALCPYHHRLIHTGTITLTGDPTQPDGLRAHGPHGTNLQPNRPPPTPHPHTTAHQLGLPPPTWQPPSGEPFDTTWFTWN